MNQVNNNYNDILSTMYLELLKLNPTEKDYINKIKLIISEKFQADYCMWYKTKEQFDKEMLNYDNEKLRFIKINNENEIFVIINSKINSELEGILLNQLKIILESLSKNISKINELHEKAFKDSLTNIANNAAFYELLASKEPFRDVGVCFIDANGLGVINNLYGHIEGNKMLITIANVLKTYIRKTDIYKTGGDEFVIVCENISEELFNSKIEQIKETLNTTQYSASFGCAYAEETNDLMELINIADENMYIEKEKYRLENPDKYSIKR